MALRRLEDLTSTSTVFDVDKIKSGHLVVLWDNANQLIGTGIISEVTPLDINCALYTGLYTGTVILSDEVTVPYRIDLEQVLSGDLKPVILDPLEFKSQY